MNKLSLTKKILAAAFAVAGLTVFCQDAQAQNVLQNTDNNDKGRMILTKSENVQYMPLVEDVKFMDNNSLALGERGLVRGGSLTGAAAGVNNISSPSEGRLGGVLSRKGIPTGYAGELKPTLDDMQSDAVTLLPTASTYFGTTYALTEITDPSMDLTGKTVVAFNGKRYYYTTPTTLSSEKADMLNYLSGSTSVALTSTGATAANAVFKTVINDETTYYTFDTSKLPKSGYAWNQAGRLVNLTNGTSSNYDFSVIQSDSEGSTTTKYYNIAIDPTKASHVGSKLSNISWSTTDPYEGQTDKWANNYVAGSNVTFDDDENPTKIYGAIRLKTPHNGVVPSRGSWNKWFTYTYTKPTDYTITQTRINDTIADDGPTSNVQNKVFAGISGASNGGAIYNTKDKSTVNIIADFVGNSSISNGGAISNYADGEGTASIGSIVGDFVGNSSTSRGGAISNYAHGEGTASIASIVGDFVGNSSSGSNSFGGAICSYIDYQYSTRATSVNASNSIISITGDFVGNRASRGGAIYLSEYSKANRVKEFTLLHNNSIQNINGDFIGNSATATSSDGGAIYIGSESHLQLPRSYYETATLNADINLQIRNINGDFIGNYAQATSGGANGGAIAISIKPNISKAYSTQTLNVSLIGEIQNITGDFVNNYASSTTSSAYGGAIFNSAQNSGSTASIGSITGDFVGNSASGSYSSGGAIYNNANNTASATIGSIVGDFVGNSSSSSSSAYGGAIYNNAPGSSATASIGSIVGDFVGNSASSSNSDAYGGAIYNSGTITSITNANFLNNYAKAGNISNAKGGAIFTNQNMTLTADGNVAKNNGISTISGNYVSNTSGATKNYEAIYVGSNSATLTFDAKNIGKFVINDYINGTTGYGLTFTGDDSGQVDYNNKIIGGAVVNINNVDFNWNMSGNSVMDTSVLKSMTIDGPTVDNTFAIDFDATNKTADKITTTGLSSGVLNLNTLNITGDFTGWGADTKVQIINNSNTSSTLQLALSSAITSVDRNLGAAPESTTYDTIDAATSWTKTYQKHVTSGGTAYGKLGRATTRTENDSIGMTNIRTEGGTTVDSKWGDTLKLVNQDTTNTTKTFTAEVQGATYNVTDNLGATKGTVNINGVAGGATETVDLKNFTGFEVGDGATALNFNNVTVGSSTATNPTIATVTANKTIGVANSTLNGNIAAENAYTLSLSGSSTLNGTVGKANASMSSGTLKFNTNTFANANSVNLTGGTVALNDNAYNTYTINNLTSGTNAKYNIDFNGTTKAKDVIQVTGTSSGTITIDTLNLTGAISGVTSDYKVQIIENSANSNVQLALSDAAKTALGGTTAQKWFETVNHVTGSDEVEAVTAWNQTFNSWHRDDTVEHFGTIGLATTAKTNDSIGYNESSTNTITGTRVDDSSLGDTLSLVNQNTTITTAKDFTAGEQGATYEVKDNLGATKGTVNINGVAGGATETVDLKNFTGFEVGDGATALNFNDVTVGSSTATNPTIATVTNNSATIGLNNTILNGSISGSGYSITTTGDTTINGTVGGNLTNTGTLNSTLANLTGSFTNNGTFNLGGQLTKDISGTGTTVLTENQTIGTNRTVEGILNVNGKTLGMSDSAYETLTVGNLTGNGNLTLNADATSTTGSSDTIHINNTGSNSVLTITALNLTTPTVVAGQTKTSTMQVLTGNTSGVSLALSTDVSEQYNTVNIVTKTGNDELDRNEIRWDANYGGWEQKETTTQTLAVSSDTALSYTINKTLGDKDYTSKAENLAIMNKYTGADYADRRINFTGIHAATADGTYVVKAALEDSSAGKMTLNGERVGDSNTTVDLHNNAGFTLSNATELVLKNIDLKDSLNPSAALITVSNNNADITLNNTKVQGAITATGGATYDITASETNSLQNVTGARVANSGDLTLNGVNNFVNMTNAAGTTEIKSGTTTVVSVEQKSVTVDSGATANLTNVDNVKTTDGITNDGDLVLAGGTADTPANNDNKITMSADAGNAKTTIAAGSNITNKADITQKEVVVSSGSGATPAGELTNAATTGVINADTINVNAGATLTNNGAIAGTDGTSASAITVNDGADLDLNAGSSTKADVTLETATSDMTITDTAVLTGNVKTDNGGAINLVADHSDIALSTAISGNITDTAGTGAGSYIITATTANLADNKVVTIDKAIAGATEVDVNDDTNAVITDTAYTSTSPSTPATVKVGNNGELTLKNTTSDEKDVISAITGQDSDDKYDVTVANTNAGTTNINNTISGAKTVTGDGGTTNLNSTITGADKIVANAGTTNINAASNNNTSTQIGTADIDINSGATAGVKTTSDNFALTNDVTGADATSTLKLDGKSGTAGTASDPGTQFNIASDVNGGTVEIANGQLNLPNENKVANADGVKVDTGATLNTMNGAPTTYNTNTEFEDASQIKVDVNAISKASDRFANPQQAAGEGVVLTDLALQDLDKIVHRNTDIDLRNTTNLSNVTVGSELLGKKFQAMTPIRMMEATIDQNAMLNIHPSSGRNDYNSFNPAVVVAPIAAQMGGYLSQLNSYDEAFRNLDMKMLMTREERQALKMANRYASEVQPHIFSETYLPEKSSAGWFRPYASFEKVGLKNGPRVENVMYGSYFGGDSQMYETKNGWDYQYSVYIGYNGSHQNYQGNSIYQNGGNIGATGVWYKKDFFTALTANVGASVADASTMYGHEDFPMLMTGVASKTGYNWELAKGKFIIQPSYTMSYTFVNTFNYTNAAGVGINSDPLHAINIAPGLKFIGNLKNGWQPYAGVQMVWNIMDKTDFHANDIALPELSVKPYFQYGVGIQKRWGDRFTGFAQAMLRSGGRNGIALSAGLRWAIGKDYHSYPDYKPKNKTSNIIKKTTTNNMHDVTTSVESQKVIVKQLDDNGKKMYANTKPVVQLQNSSTNINKQVSSVKPKKVSYKNTTLTSNSAVVTKL